MRQQEADLRPLPLPVAAHRGRPISPGDEYDAWKVRLGRALACLPVRPTLPRPAIEYIVESAQRLKLSRGTIIFGEGDQHHFSYVLTDGVVRVECAGHRGEPLAIQLIRPGRLFGVAWRPRKRRRMIRATAATDAQAALVTQDTIVKAYESVSQTVRLGVMSYMWRTLSSLVVERAEARLLLARD